ncbi:RNA polymerase II transcription factor b subunit 3 [Pseudohyphozyma bogoriensis]|nr:RNA polymerase II transcription factor b subunit 3 [Pseudohyphozyma bogoriensis]
MAPPRYILGKRSAGPSTPSGSGTVSRAPPPKQTEESEDRRLSEYSSPEDVCPVCRTDRYLQPKLRLMVSSCYHKMCESCIDRLFSLGPSPCPECNTTIRKAGFKPQLFENLAVQREVAIRKRVARVFYRKEEGGEEMDPEKKKEYDNWLEEGEELTFDLLSSDLATATKAEAKLKNLEDTHRLLIEANLSNAELEAELFRRREEEERAERERGREEALREAEEEDRRREEMRKGVLLGLESSDASASSVLSNALKRASRAQTTTSNLSSLTNLSLRHLLGSTATVVSATELETWGAEDAVEWFEDYEWMAEARDLRESEWGVGGFVEWEREQKGVKEALDGWWYYAKAHYYGFTLYTLADDLPGLPGHSGTWIKVFGIRRRLKGELAKPAKDRIAWIAWTDMDTVILNFKIRFEDFLPPKEMAKPPFLVGVGDGNGYNSGVWFLSVSDRSLEFLETVIGVIDQPNPPELPYHEQTAMEMVVEAEQLVARKEVALVPREWIMSWEEEVSSGHKAFLVHLAGLTKKKFLPGYLALAEKRMEYQTTEERERLERERREYQEEARVYWEGWEARKMK